MSAPEWAELNPANKHLARIIAHARALRDPVFSHRSAAIIHGIQTLNVPDKLQVLGSGGPPIAACSTGRMSPATAPPY